MTEQKNSSEKTEKTDKSDKASAPKKHSIEPRREHDGKKEDREGS